MNESESWDAEAIRMLRAHLKCTRKELAETLGIEPSLVASWERGEQFPTKRICEKLLKIKEQGASAIVRKQKPKAATRAENVLSDPEFWRLIRKLIAHPTLRQDAEKLAQSFADPDESSPPQQS
jgi:transcriptional regulator with XRE-family HTH domain